eukprot:CAMPEP_0118672012 /NCGR_PEP_ID=MMETSP0785-20121206/22312_1 /TAXON_ID=91992 /ORGANISM="Bolidomonas pacifica, Strain CCMP 1866" /LENGTH=99 /DNA_ID=CAMNT_0006566943 /DNA_START=242 /DNA_END=541 /DNA_ORIENTATION=-
MALAIKHLVPPRRSLPRPLHPLNSRIPPRAPKAPPLRPKDITLKLVPTPFNIQRNQGGPPTHRGTEANSTVPNLPNPEQPPLPRPHEAGRDDVPGNVPA